MEPNKDIPSWDKYFMSLADMAAKRSKCLRRSVGSILVKDKQIIATGYNGPPAGTPSCAEKGGCLREKLNIPSGQRDEICRAAHAEVNTIAQAAKHGISTDGSTLYCVNKPCVICMKILINAGIKKIIYREEYDSELADELAKEAGLELVKYRKEPEKIVDVSDKTNPDVNASVNNALNTEGEDSNA